MRPLEFFKKACRARRYKEKAWVFSVFGCTRTSSQQLLNGRYLDVHRIDGQPFWVDENGEHQEFTDWNEPPNTPLLSFKDKVDLVIGDIPNLEGPVTTTVGNLFVNWYGIVHALGVKIPFQTGEVTVKSLLALIHPVFSSDIMHPDGTINYEAQDPKMIYAHEYVTFIKCMTALAGFVEVSVPSATPYTARTAPGIKELRDKLLKEHEHELNDPTVIAAIEKQLIAKDKEWIDQDPDKGFYIKGKSFNIVRKKLFLMGGIEANFNGDGGYTLVKNSLMEGPQLETLPALINTLRNGSYSRGALTALGGEAVKFFQRVLQNSRVVAGDCGVTYGVPYAITKANHKNFRGRYHIVNGETVAIGEDTEALIGKVIEFRTSQTCRLEHTDYCAVCMGDEVAKSPNGLSAMGSNMGSIFMTTMMAAMHSVELKVKSFNVKLHIS